jgi:iron complex outermembrane recepter protein
MHKANRQLSIAVAAILAASSAVAENAAATASASVSEQASGPTGVEAGARPSSIRLAQARHRFQLEPQPLGQALNALASQASLNLYFNPADVADKSTAGLRAQATTDQALQKLLAGTDLEATYVNENTVKVGKKGSVSSLTKTSHQTYGSQGELKLAQNDTFDMLGMKPVAPEGEDVGSSNADHSKNDSLQEIVVTAQKRAERLIDVPISIVVLGAEELQKRRINSIDDLSLAVPGMSIQSSGSYERRIVLRGLGNFSANNSLSPSVGMYLDEASVTSWPTLSLDLRTYDLDRIEVLRGPQGTLYGDGSIGGTVRFITHNPVLDRTSMTANVAARVTEDGEPGQQIEAVANVPLIDNTLGLRIVGTFANEGGWIDQPAADRQDYNGSELANVRMKGLWRPSSALAINAMAIVHRNDTAPTLGEDEDGNYTQPFNLTTTPHAQDDYELYNLTLTYEFSAAQLLSTSSYVDQEKENSFSYQIPFLGATAAPLDILVAPQVFKGKAFTQEVRLTSLGESPWQWSVGAFYRHAQFDFLSTLAFGFTGPAGTPAPTLSTGAPSTYQSDSAALFGDTRYALTDRLTIGAGVRYFEDEQENSLSAGPPIDGKFNATNPRVYLQYKLGDAVNTYASAAKGFRSGGFNANGSAYDSEFVWTYELGAKWSALNRALSAETALFYTDYKDYQIVGLDPAQITAGSITSNLGDARIRGVELGLTWRPTSEWTLGVNGSYVDSELTRIDALSASHDAGDRLDLFPKVGFTLFTERSFRLQDRPGFARLDYNQHGRQTFRNRNVAGPTPWYNSESDEINMLNASLGVQWNDNLSLQLFGQNLLDDRGYLDPLSIQNMASRSRPRTYGIGFGVTFD